MKSSEEFYAEGGWNTDAAAIASIKARDLEMWKKGMTDAAEIPVKYAVDIGRIPVNGMRHLLQDGRGELDQIRKTYKQAILKLRDETKSV